MEDEQRERVCMFCDSPITQADDGAWEDASGACGCDEGEHVPAAIDRDRADWELWQAGGVPDSLKITITRPDGTAL